MKLRLRKRQVLPGIFFILLIMGVAGLGLSLVVEPVGKTLLDPARLRPGKTEGVYLMKMPTQVEKWEQRGVPPGLWVGGVKVQEESSVAGLGEAAGPACRIREGNAVYINRPLLDQLQAGAASAVVAGDLSQRLGQLARGAVALSLLAGMFWVLRLARPVPGGVPGAGGASKRLVALDSLRGIAATMVMMIHAMGLFFPPAWFFGYPPAPDQAVPWFKSWFQSFPLAFTLNGHLMVQVFWILSGVVLSLPHLERKSHPAIAMAAAKRYFRLMPLAFVTVIASYYLHVMGWYQGAAFNAATRYGVANLAMSGGTEVSLYQAVKDALFFGPGYNMPLWTISCEFIGSLVLFGVLACTLSLARRRLVWLVLLGAFTTLGGATYLTNFMVGLLLADHYLKKGASARATLGAGVSWSLVVAVVVLGSIGPAWPQGFLSSAGPWVALMLTIATGGLLVGLALYSSSVRRVLSWRPLVWLGERSFAIYVVHALTIHLIGHGAAVLAIRWGMSPLGGSFVGLAAFIVSTLGISHWLTREVDLPSLALANRAGRWIAGEKGADSTAAAVPAPGASPLASGNAAAHPR
jgi:peptidoglycan/LPS O-acetylase OafA/YrhL